MRANEATTRIMAGSPCKPLSFGRPPTGKSSMVRRKNLSQHNLPPSGRGGCFGNAEPQDPLLFRRPNSGRPPKARKAREFGRSKKKKVVVSGRHPGFNHRVRLTHQPASTRPRIESLNKEKPDDRPKIPAGSRLAPFMRTRSNRNPSQGFGKVRRGHDLLWLKDQYHIAKDARFPQTAKPGLKSGPGRANRPTKPPTRFKRNCSTRGPRLSALRSVNEVI